MPKEKQQQQRSQSRRAASKEALKQMHLLLGDEKKYEISSDDDDVIEVEVQPPKKKYKLTHRKSSDGNDRDVLVLKTVEENLFDLEVVVEELTPCQKSRFAHQKKEVQEVDAKIDKLLNAPNTEVIYNGVFTTAVEISEQIQSIISKTTATAQPTQFTLPPQTTTLPSTTPSVQQPVSQSIVLQQQQTTSTMPQSYQLVMDPRLGVIVGTVANPNSNTPPLQLYQPKVTMTAAASPVNNNEQPTMKTRRGAIVRQVPNTTPMPPLHKTPIGGQKASPVAKQNKTLQVKQNLMTKNVQAKSKATAAPPKPILPMKGRPPNPATYRPTETSVEGGLSMGKPSNSIDLTSDDGRALPDSREVSFNKLQGRTYPSLVVVARPHLRVKDLASDRGKLDVKVKSVLMYPPTKFTEWLIQQGLVRSDQKCSVHTNNPLKLGMYSDASKFPYSGGYVWISECCPQKFVSVFSGSLFEGSQHPPMALLKLLYHWCCQTIVQNVTQWVKVDNLYVKGMYTWLRSVCSVALHTHVKQLGGPGVKVQVGVISLGTTSQDGNKREVKVEVLGILETTTRHIRLRAVEPLADGERNYKKRFNKILEPVFNWVHPSSIIVTDLTVDKSTLNQMGFLQVSQSTSTDYANSNRTIMEYLRRIVPRMFQNTLSLLSRQIIQQFLDELVWREWYGTTVLQCFDNMIQHLSEQTRYDGGQSLVARLNKVSANPFKNWSIPLTPTNTVTTPKTTEIHAPKRYSRQRKPIAPQPPAPAVQDVVRPAKSTSPDVPEQLVPLENYYYGTITPPQVNKNKISINIKCPFCKLTFNTNITLMNHLFKHAHNVSNDVQLCKYCLMIVPTGNDLLKHIGTSHPDETKFDNGFVCLICECHFRNPFILGKHMSKEHCPSELPYLCGTCSFRCSNHKQAVDHFYQQHDHGATIQCPFCLKSTTIFSGGRNISQNMNYFIQHLQKHQKKQLAKRCGKCTLWFIQKEFVKDHQAKMHVSQRGRGGLVPSFAPRNGIMVPKSRMDKCPDDAKIINFSTLYFNVGKTLTCKECNKPLSSPKHFASFESCQNSNCQYSTCCSNAMQEHVGKCKALHANLPEEKLPYEMFCICGYRDIFGNQMAKHLAICERKSAYPSRQAAKGATVTQCMLDVLGLVRKPEETKEVKESKEIKETKETKRPESGNSVTPIILKRGRPRKYPPPIKTPDKEVIAKRDNRKVENKQKGDVQINISEVRGGVDSTNVKEEKESTKSTKKIAEEVDLIKTNTNKESVEGNKDEVRKEEESTSTSDEKKSESNKNEESTDETDRATDEKEEKPENTGINEEKESKEDLSGDTAEHEVATDDKDEVAEVVPSEDKDEVGEIVPNEDKENEAPPEGGEKETPPEGGEKEALSEDRAKEGPLSEKKDAEEVKEVDEEKDGNGTSSEIKDKVSEVQDHSEETTPKEVPTEKKPTDESDPIETELTAIEQESEVSKDDEVVSEGKEVTEDEKTHTETVNSVENAEDANEQLLDKIEESERMEVDSCSNTETIDKVAIENEEMSENINDICPMDTD